MCILGLCIYGYKKMSLQAKSKEAFDLSQAGFKTEALETYSTLNQSYIKSGPAMFAYAKQLYNANKLSEAGMVIEETKRFYTDNELYKLSAAIEYELGNLKKAEEDYKTALYMVPNRMRSRYELMNFYFAVKDTAKAIYWGQSILNMPVKIPSISTENLQKQTKILLSAIKK